jgi:excisionase family DNA binding protein
MSATRPSLGTAGDPTDGRDVYRQFPAASRQIGLGAGGGPGQLATSGLPGRAFRDLLLLGALACQAPVALLSVPQEDGTWSTLAHGLDTRHGSNEGQLFQAIAASDQPVEVADLMTRLPRSPLVLPPHSLRWAYGTALRGDAGTVLGVVVVLDRWLREITRREQRALPSLARQLGAQLVQWARPAATSAAPLRSIGAAGRHAHPAGTGAAGASAGVQEPRGGRAGISESRPGPLDAFVTTAHSLLRTQEVAEIFDVTERTVINWAAAGKLPSLRTIGGHLRFRREDVIRLLTPLADPSFAG